MDILLQVRGENRFLHIGEAFSWIVKKQEWGKNPWIVLNSEGFFWDFMLITSWNHWKINGEKDNEKNLDYLGNVHITYI